MQNISSVAGLKNAIQILEVDQGVKGGLLKEQVYFMYESLKPINILRNSLKELFSSHRLIENIPGTIKSFAQAIFQHLFSKKEMSTRKPVGQRDID
jgi:hypothetical protein